MIGAAVGLGILTSGCGEAKPSHSSSNSNTVQIEGPIRGPALGPPYPGILHCVAQLADAWQPTPSDINAPKIAATLGGVSPDQVLEGRWGPATCEEAITASQADSRAIVRGIGSKCVVLGVKAGPTPKPPSPDQKFHDVLAVCAMTAI